MGIQSKTAACAEAGSAKRARGWVGVQSIEELGAEEPCHRADREQEAAVTDRDPARSICCEGPARHDTVQRGMESQGLAPGVKDGGDADLAAGVGFEVAGIAGEGGERVVCHYSAPPSRRASIVVLEDTA